jgi:hypothetical protein
VEARFSAPVQTGPVTYPTSCTMDTGFFPRAEKRPERDTDPSPPSSAVGHEIVELYLYFPYGPYGLYKGDLYLYLYVCTVHSIKILLLKSNKCTLLVTSTLNKIKVTIKSYNKNFLL